MFFFSLALFLLGTWCLPWWIVALVGLAMGWIQPRPWNGGVSVGLAAAFAWAALAFIEDGRNFGLVSRRLAGLFSLPTPSLIFLVMAGLAFITAFLSARSGMVLRSLISPKTD